MFVLCALVQFAVGSVATEVSSGGHRKCINNAPLIVVVCVDVVPVLPMCSVSLCVHGELIGSVRRMGKH